MPVFWDTVHQCGLLNHSLSSDSTSIELQVGDALNYKRTAKRDPFDVVFIDIFDDDNIFPPSSTPRNSCRTSCCTIIWVVIPVVL
jgi:hypothetical protein